MTNAFLLGNRADAILRSGTDEQLRQLTDEAESDFTGLRLMDAEGAMWQAYWQAVVSLARNRRFVDFDRAIGFLRLGGAKDWLLPAIVGTCRSDAIRSLVRAGARVTPLCGEEALRSLRALGLHR